MEPQLIFTLLLIVLVAFIVCIFLAWYFAHSARLKERLLLIEKGMDPDQFLKKTNAIGTSLWLKAGVVVIGVSLGIAVAGMYLIAPTYKLPLLGIFAGISFIVAHYIDRKNRSR